MSGGITDSLNFQPKMAGAKSRSYRVVVNPIGGGSASPSEVIKCDVPTGRGRYTFCDPSQSFITFQLKSTDAAVMNLNGSAYSLFNRLDVLAGGQILETISDYGHTVATLLDLNMAGADAAVSGSVALGTKENATNNVDKTGAQVAIGGTLDFSLPIALSGILGASCSKYLPVGIMSDLRAEFTVESAALGVVCATATPAWTIQNFTLNLMYIELDPQVADQIHSANGGTYRISTEGWRTYSTVGVSGRASDSVLVPARFSSARTLLTTYRNNASATNAAYWISHRVNPYFHATQKCSIQFAIGSSLVPHSPIQFGTSEAYTMMLQAFHSLGNAAHNNRCTLTNWNQTAATTGADTMGTFAVAVNLDSMLFKSKDLSVGMNTLTSPVFLQGTFPTAPTIAHRITSMVHYDALLEISEQGTTIRF